MSLQLPPIPQSPISENKSWRDWLQTLYSVVKTINSSTSAATSHNSLTGLQGGGGSERYHLLASENQQLTGGGDTSLHYHSYDLNRANHVGTQDVSTITGLTPTVVLFQEEIVEDFIPIPGPKGADGINGSSVVSNVISSPTTVATDTSYVVISYLTVNSDLTNNGNLMVIA